MLFLHLVCVTVSVNTVEVSLYDHCYMRLAQWENRNSTGVFFNAFLLLD